MKDYNNRPIYMKHKLSNVITISKIVTIHYYEFGKNFHFSGESHDFWEFLYVDSGEVNVTASKTEYTLKKGDYIFHKPNEFHAVSANHKSPSNVFVISFVSTSKNMVYFKNKKGTLPDNLRTYVEILLKEGKKTFDLPFMNTNLRGLKLSENPPFGGQQIIRSTLEQLLIMLIRAEINDSKNANIFPNKERMDNHLVNSVIELLNNNIYGKITVDEICQKLNYSKTYISKIFNEICNCTIIEYYTNLKIKEAKLLMRKNNHNITQISDMLCFNNPHYFSRVFKKITNMTPKEYFKSVSE
ncbi:MAG: AraC family transcriptional regulator [Clostridia bacterium]|nr:AraC family transcriptional regulator [Clostridia bacterium]